MKSPWLTLVLATVLGLAFLFGLLLFTMVCGPLPGLIASIILLIAAVIVRLRC